MRKISFLLILLAFACKDTTKENNVDVAQDSAPQYFESVDTEVILEDDSLSVRAIEVIGKNLAFAGNNGKYGLYNSVNNTWKTNTQKFDTISPEYRAVASTANDFFMISVASPALLYKTGNSGKMELVYKEDDEKAFYDAMAFWNDNEGIAMGDPTDGCISMIVTRDGGKSWNKINCENLPEAAEGEAAFAASNSNIAIQGDKTWILTGGVKSRIIYSADKGKSWEVFETPLLQGTPTTGGYSLDFYDEMNGIIIGGDYTNAEGNTGNKAITKDGGKTWELVAEGKDPGYKSSVRYVPNSNAEQILATGFTGIHYSKNAGKSWEKISDEGFYTLRFVNDSTAYAAGKGRIAKLTFR
ncbi:WD40/YVTN/BNR-like repeat-containing protein [Christiangramia sp. SM2212]|uniref:Oxidoreductase n=1 Tax=Christiangramia sediminicola TaxID=3073267 RepID=A0ABU1EPA3_9FLAO|nr:oxidoreductase [Christiangramia sp. SM2212]MDR5590038.1 oxidoreductase [Christiangramia sp. SM2212]